MAVEFDDESLEEEDLSRHSSKGSSTGPGPSYDREEKLGAKETTLVNRSKAFVFCFLFIAAVTVGVVTFRFTVSEDMDNFQVSFTNYADDIINNAEDNAVKTVSVITEMSSAITSAALSTNQTFPFVKLPHFSLQVTEKRKLSGAEYLAWVPLVSASQKEAWNEYAGAASNWLKEEAKLLDYDDYNPGSIAPEIYRHVPDDPADAVPDIGLYAPVWELYPLPPDAYIINKDLMSFKFIRPVLLDVIKHQHVLFSGVQTSRFLFLSDRAKKTDNEFRARSFILVPVYENFDRESPTVVGFIVAKIPWDTYFQYSLPADRRGIMITIENTCGSGFSYIVDGPTIKHSGYKDTSEADYGHMAITHDFANFTRFDGSGCDYKMTLYPTHQFRQSYITNKPVIYTSGVSLVFLFTAAVFVLYDLFVARRQRMLLATAYRTQNIVASMFPSNVRKRILDEAKLQAEQREHKGHDFVAKNELREYLGNSEGSSSGSSAPVRGKPIADLFPEVTIMFADIVGFTAWSSMREPSQVFTLLETIYHAFDTIAHRRRVFKVETVGDCYVAVSGLPDPRKDHAIVMTKFARDCLYKLSQLTKELEFELGPDTADLGIRVGLHSGPVTAGVLRGERSRFQLFGDTMNTCSRIETTGEKNRIHISKETAQLLINSGREHWIKPREKPIVAKGKGEMTTYWVDIKIDPTRTIYTDNSQSATDDIHLVEKRSLRKNTNLSIQEDSSELSSESNSSEKNPDKLLAEVNPEGNSRHWRLIGWNTDIMAKILKQVVDRRQACRTPVQRKSEMKKMEMILDTSKSPLNEVVQIIKLPAFRGDVRKASSTEPLSDKVMKQLREYISTVAAMYRPNPFHNYEHASHVTMSVVKLLSRIVAPTRSNEDASSLHDHTYGITSDPLTQFAVVLSALIHDIDHPGIPNNQLIKEESTIARVYKNKSVAEQNSIDLAWSLLMEDSFIDLRAAIYANETEYKRFRQLLVNTVMATDIMDKDLGALRKKRWEKAFSELNVDESAIYTINRKATIVIEHLIQASDVAHTMQHWQIYRKWNERLFREMYDAYKHGRAEKDPASGWYEGEIGFFDFYIIPLARKLKDCGVFGVSSDEYLNYALQNRAEWVEKGQAVVAEMVEAVRLESRGEVAQ